MINCLSLNCRFRLSICSLKAVTSAELLFEHFYFVWVVKISGVSVLQDAPFITIGSRSSKILTDSDVDSPELDSFWSKYIYKKNFWSYVWYVRPFFSSKCCFHKNKIGASKFQKYSWNKKVGNFFLHYTRRQKRPLPEASMTTFWCFYHWASPPHTFHLVISVLLRSAFSRGHETYFELLTWSRIFFRNSSWAVWNIPTISTSCFTQYMLYSTLVIIWSIE